MNTTKAPVTEEQLTAFVAARQAVISAYYEANFEHVSAAILSVELGRRYAKIVSTSGASRSAWGFVDMTTGDILKAASWKGPEKNFARGNVHSLGDSGRAWIYSIR